MKVPPGAHLLGLGMEQQPELLLVPWLVEWVPFLAPFPARPLVLWMGLFKVLLLDRLHMGIIIVEHSHEIKNNIHRPVFRSFMLDFRTAR